MPILRMKEIISMSSEDRTKKVSELRAELSRLRTMISAGGSVENPTRVRELRRTIAQILTVENENRLGIRGKAKESQKTEAKPKKPKATSAKKPKETKPE
jgi:large subunit ribosomal protein L29